jgi:hypothetical protein
MNVVGHSCKRKGKTGQNSERCYRRELESKFLKATKYTNKL